MNDQKNTILFVVLSGLILLVWSFFFAPQMQKQPPQPPPSGTPIPPPVEPPKTLTREEALALSPRELMRWALNHLHPTTLANMVNIPFSHNSHTNRIFWRVDSTAMIVSRRKSST